MSCDWQKLPPVFHQPDLPLAGDLLGVLWRRALHGARGCRCHHDALGQARVWRAQLVGRDVSCGSCGGETERRVELATFTCVASAWRVSGLLCFLTFFLWKVTLSALLPVSEDRGPQTVAVKGFLLWKMTFDSVYLPDRVIFTLRCYSVRTLNLHSSLHFNKLFYHSTQY